MKTNGRPSAALLQDLCLEEILLSWITVDGIDATQSLLKMVEGKTRNIDLILLASISYAGFNLMDPVEIQAKLCIPVIIVNPKKPDSSAVTSAIRRHFPDWEARLEIIHRSGQPSPIKLDASRKLYLCSFGLSQVEAKKVSKNLIIFGNRPEPRRVVRIFARGLGRMKERIR